MGVVLEVIALQELVREVAARHGVGDRLVTAHLPPVAADRGLVTQLFDALLGGEGTSSPDGPRVVVTGHRLGDQVVVQLSAGTDCSTYARTEPGSSLVAEIVERHGGTFGVGEGPGGTGSTVRFTLPATGSRVARGTAVSRQVEVA